MNPVAIRANRLSKRFRIGQREPYKALRDVLAIPFQWPFRLLKSKPGSSGLSHSNMKAASSSLRQEWFWALKDLTFEIKQGEVIGIIGRNGAGKSTLLKILSKITQPTEGRAEIHGRIGSLLEVGTGFHPELTGRENIFLNGAILGMKRLEIQRKFDEMVSFAEIERFLDTPVKYYSSGMYIRLAFAVAAHLEPEILLVDEVLAVGDAAFQKKCLGRMGEVAKAGRTVLYVSHQMNSVRKLCGGCIWLDRGEIRMADSTVKVLSAYEASFKTNGSAIEGRVLNSHVGAKFSGWEIIEANPQQSNLLDTLNSVTFKFTLEVNRPIRNGHHGIALWNSDGQLLWAWATSHLTMEPGLHELHYRFPNLPLRPGIYSWKVSLYDEESIVDEWHCVPDLIIATPPVTHPRDEWSGILNLPCEFKVSSKKMEHV